MLYIALLEFFMVGNEISIHVNLQTRQILVTEKKFIPFKVVINM